MSDLLLTSRAKKLMRVLYAVFKEKVDRGVPSDQANYFYDDDNIRARYFPEWTSPDIADLCWDLHRKSLLIVQRGDDKANDVTLSQDGIAFMESRPARWFDKATEIFDRLKPF